MSNPDQGGQQNQGGQQDQNLVSSSNKSQDRAANRATRSPDSRSSRSSRHNNCAPQCELHCGSLLRGTLLI